MAAKSDVTLMISSICAGDSKAASELLPLVYDELRQLAAGYLVRERADHTLQATALVHEAYLRLADQTQVSWQGHAHFCGVAARVMRQLLVDHARRRGRSKRKAQGKRISLDHVLLVGGQTDEEIELLDSCLTRLASFDVRKSQVVELRYFGGLRVKEVAEVLGVSERTVADDWAYAKAWLHRELRRESNQ